MECEHPVPLSPRCLAQDAELHEIMDQRIRCCGCYVQHTSNVGSSELRRFVEMVQKLLRRVRKGGTVVCAGIHMSDIPAFPYAWLWNERRLLSVVLGTSSDAERAAESQKLLNFGFQQFETVRLFAKGQTATVLPIWKGVGNSLKAGFLEDLYVSLPKGQSSKLKATLETRQPLIAPVQHGQPVGALKLTLGSRPLVEFPVVALESISIAGLLGRGWDSLRLLFR